MAAAQKEIITHMAAYKFIFFPIDEALTIHSLLRHKKEAVS